MSEVLQNREHWLGSVGKCSLISLLYMSASFRPLHLSSEDASICKIWMENQNSATSLSHKWLYTRWCAFLATKNFENWGRLPQLRIRFLRLWGPGCHSPLSHLCPIPPRLSWDKLSQIELHMDTHACNAHHEHYMHMDSRMMEPRDDIFLAPRDAWHFDGKETHEKSGPVSLNFLSL